MRSADRYVSEVLSRVFATPEDRERFESDLRAHFEEGEARGESAGEILQRLGPPEEVAAAFNAERPLRYAGFWLRSLAFAADLGLFVTFSLPLLAAVIRVGERATPAEAAGAVWTVLVALAGLAVIGFALFYFPLAEARFGKTLGKHLLGLRVLGENGAPVGLGPAFVRRLSFYFEMLVLDALFIPFTEKRQRALDVIAKTVVAREPGVVVPGSRYALCLALVVLAPLGVWIVALLCRPS